jgi:O-antigen/teichoic acid export membrane protein
MNRLWLLIRNHRLASVAQVTMLRILSLTANMATGMLSAWMLEPQGRGVQAAMMVGPQTLTGIFDLGLHASLIYNMKADPRHAREFFSSALLIAAAVGFIGMTVGWVIAPLFLRQYPASTIFDARLLMMMVPIGVISNVLIGILEGHGGFGFVSRQGLAGCLITLLALVLLWAFGRLTPASAASAYLLPTVPICLLLWLRARHICPPAPRFELSYIRHMLYCALRFFGVDLLSTVGVYLDQFILVIFLDAHNVGIYAVAISAAKVLSVIPSSISTVLFPTVAGRSREAIVEIVGVVVRISGVLIAGAAFGLALAAPFALTLLYGAKFEEAIVPFRLLLAYTVISNLVSMQYQIFSAAGRPELVSAFEFIGVAASGACMLVLVPHMGVIGAAISLIIAAILKLICVLAGIPLFLRLPVPRLIVSKADISRVLGHKSKEKSSNDRTAMETS